MTSKAQKVQLDFNMSVAKMLEKAGAFYNHALTDQAALAAIDPDITPAYLSQMQLDIDAGYSAKSPETAKGELMIATQGVEAQLEASRNLFQELMFYVKKAFPDNHAKLVAYGQEKYLPARQSAGRMEVLMGQANLNIGNDSAVLTTVGYTVPKQTAFDTASQTLKSLNRVQETLKGTNLQNTETYYETMNTVWGEMVALHDAAVIAFKDDYAKYRNYLLYDPDTTDLAFTLVLPDTNPVFHHFIETIDPGQEIQFEMLAGNSDASLAFALADGGSPVGTVHNLPQGGSVTFFYSDFGGVGQFLRVGQTGIVEMRVRVTLPGV